MFGRIKFLFGNFTRHIKALYEPTILEEAKEEVAKEYGLSTRELDVDVRHVHLPVIQRIKIAGGNVYREIGKILGAYNPELNKIYLDTGLRIKSLFDPEAWRTYLNSYVHELTHVAHKIKGKLKPRNDFSDYLDNYEDDENEVEARRVADKVTSKLLGKYGNEGSLSPYSMPFD